MVNVLMKNFHSHYSVSRFTHVHLYVYSFFLALTVSPRFDNLLHYVFSNFRSFKLFNQKKNFFGRYWPFSQDFHSWKIMLTNGWMYSWKCLNVVSRLYHCILTLYSRDGLFISFFLGLSMSPLLYNLLLPFFEIFHRLSL